MGIIKPDVFIVVISYNGIRYTSEAALSLSSQEKPTRFLIWDNNSIDATPNWLRKTDYEYFLSDKNLLWSPAVNAAIEKFWDGESIIGFMNNDAVLPPHATRYLSETLEDEKIGIVGPTGAGIGGDQDFAAHHGSHIDVDRYCSQLGLKEVSQLMGVFMMMRKSTWDKVGPLDADMPLGADDLDYSLRVKQADLKVIVDERVYIKHYDHRTGSSDNWDKHLGPSWEAFHRKWG